MSGSCTIHYALVLQLRCRKLRSLDFLNQKKIQNKNFQTFENTYAAQFLKDARVIQPKYQKS